MAHKKLFKELCPTKPTKTQYLNTIIQESVTNKEPSQQKTTEKYKVTEKVTKRPGSKHLPKKTEQTTKNKLCKWKTPTITRFKQRREIKSIEVYSKYSPRLSIEKVLHHKVMKYLTQFIPFSIQKKKYSMKKNTR